MYYIDKLGTSYFGQWGVPKFVMAASNHIVAAIRELGTQWDQREISSLSICLIYHANGNKMKWNESGFRPPLCTYRLNWARRTSWGWWDDWDYTVLQTQDSKFESWRSEAEHATSRSRRLPTILTFTRGWGRNIFCFFSNHRDWEPNPKLWRERQRC